MPRILIIDNYDSFTYNLFHYLESLGADTEVILNDEVDPETCLTYDGIILSPGPGLPEDAGKLMEIISLCTGKVPILGICLGMQALALSQGGELYNQKFVRHGVEESVTLHRSPLFIGLVSPINVGLYHSWAVKEGNENLKETAFSSNGTLMAFENDDLRIYGLQFHPESVMTPQGRKILENFLQIVSAK